MNQFLIFDNQTELENDLKSFRERSVKAKSIFEIRGILKSTALKFVSQHHYLGDAKFFSKFSFGLFHKSSDTLCGVTTFSNPQGAVTMKGWFGLTNQDQSVLELSRLCVLPSLNGTNATSYLLGQSIRFLKKENIRAVITLADNSRHNGSIYQVCNFKYYGLSNPKSDFFSYDGDGKLTKNFRGKTSQHDGVWLPRTRKHRYAYIIDPSLQCNYTEQLNPKKSDFESYNCICEDEKVFDKRFSQYYSCPNCTGQLVKIQ